MAEVPSAAAGSVGGPLRRPWTQAWFDAVPIAPVWVGCILAVGHVLLGSVYFAVLVAPRFNTAWSAYGVVVLSNSVFGLLIGYATAALAYARRGHEAALRDLRPALRCGDAELSALQRDVLRFHMRELRWVGVIFAIGAMAVTYFTTDVVLAFRGSLRAVAWVLWQNALAFWLLSRTIAHDLRVSRVFSRAAQRNAGIDLFDLTPLKPLARRGLHSALLIVLAISFFSLIVGVGHISPLLPVAQTTTVLLAAFALALPSLGIRRRIRAAKRDELARISAELRAVRAQGAALGQAERREIDSRLATLLALRQHVDAAHEWPFDLGTLGRFLLYAVIGVGSWVGGAAVERLLDALLG